MLEHYEEHFPGETDEKVIRESTSKSLDGYAPFATVKEEVECVTCGRAIKKNERKYHLFEGRVCIGCYQEVHSPSVEKKKHNCARCGCPLFRGVKEIESPYKQFFYMSRMLGSLQDTSKL